MSAPADFDVVIVGGGLHGCSAAYHLAHAGLKTVLLEKHVVARHASSASAGGVRRLGRDPAEIPLAMASIEMWHAMRANLGDDGEFRATGQVRVAENEAELKQCEARAAQVRALGYDHEVVIDRKELRRLVPAVAEQCIGGLYTARDGYAFPFKATTAFRLKAEALGAIVREGQRVQGIERSGERWLVTTNGGQFRAPVLVNAAGAWGAEIARMLGEDVPIEPVALMMMVSGRMPHFLDPTVGSMGRKMSFKQMQSGTVVIGGGHRGRVDPATELTELEFQFLGESARTVAAIFPLMKNAPLVRCWAGIEGFTPDELPIIGPSKKAPGVFHSFGFCGHGFQLGPVVGSITAQLVTGGKTNLPIEPFRVDRFAGSAPQA
ncbi:MAG: FAD-binding oxidoreductase [Alphaproteobacteria bacterium]|nr:FAD-binding oxidoreductase [Alphaproteobacteria bacterium]